LTFDESRLPFDDPEETILSIKVVDPACGSGHFLIAAAHRLARHLARARTGDEEPAPAELRAALRDVVRHCIHGVDINPMAVELCKVALWMETLDPGKPLSFLDRNIQCGNSLIGTTPALLEQGIPDDAFKPITGDDKVYCREFKKKNRQQREGQLSLFAPDLQPWERLGNLAAGMLNLDGIGEDTLEDVRRKQEMYEELVRSSDYEYGRLWADAWCAAFVWKKTKEFAYPITEEVFRRVERNPFDVVSWMVEEIKRLRGRYQFFHWHLAFPQVFRLPGKGETPENEAAGWSGGFDVVLGNPPWEGLRTDSQEFFSVSAPEIAGAPNMAVRNRLIGEMRETYPLLYSEWLEEVRRMESVRLFVREAGRYPLTSYGRLNTYSLFAGLAGHLLCIQGRWGMVLPIGIATDSFNQYFFRNLTENDQLISLYGFENEEFVFPSVHHAFKFGLVTVAGGSIEMDPELAFFLRSVLDLEDPGRTYRLTKEDFELINPNTLTCPVFRNRCDAEIARLAYRHLPVILKKGDDKSPWGVKCQLMFMMNTVSELAVTTDNLAARGFHARPTTVYEAEGYLPLYEAKMFHQYDHRFGTYLGQTEAQANQGKLPELTDEEHADPNYFPLPRYWVPLEEISASVGDCVQREWLVSWRDVTSSVVYRTMIAAILPYAATNDSAPLAHFPDSSPLEVCCFVSNANSFAFDFVARQKLGGNHPRFFTFYQLPVVPPDQYHLGCPWSGSPYLDWITPRVVELSYTAWDLQPFAQDCGYDGPPFRWDEERRFLLRCELDAAYFHLYAIARDDVDYIMETFPIVKCKDEAAHGEYRTKRVILEIYDAMQRAIETGQSYQTLLDPPPADPRVAHPPQEG